MEIIESVGDFTTNIKRALSDIDGNYQSYRGLIVGGSHTPRDIEYKISKIKEAREQGIPFLGTCLGHQLAFIEYCRNVLHIKTATSEEFGQRIGEPAIYVVKKMPELKVGIREVDGRMESFWNNYEIDLEMLKYWKKPDSQWTSQYHPEYTSDVGNPHPMLVGFINACKEYGKKRRENVN